MAGYEVVAPRGECSGAKYRRETLHHHDEIRLEHFSGVYYASKTALSANPNNGNIVFPASSIMVILDPRYTQQTFIENPSSREITAVTFSDDGRLVAYGENGIDPSISVFNSRHCTQVSRFKIEGKCTVKALLFHPRSIYLAVLPYHDYSILIYDFVCGRKLSATRWCVEPLAAAITKMDGLLVVCGHRKITCFSMTSIDLRYQTSAVLDRHAILLGKHGQYTFIDITCGSELHAKRIYTVTSCGYLCDIQSGDIVLNHVSKISDKCFCIKYNLGLLFIGCENGMVKICNPKDLTVSASVCVHDIFGPDQMQPISWIIKSDILALAINPETNIITTLLSDQKRHSWRFNFCSNAIECSPVIPLVDSNNPSPVPQIITSHEIQCHLAHTLFQLKRNKLKHRGGHFLQRPSFRRRMQVNATKITPDGKEIISGNKLGEIKVYNATTGFLTKVIEAHSSNVTVIELLYNDSLKLVASGGRDRVIFILDVAKDYHLVQAIGDNSAAIVSLSLVGSSATLTLVSSSADGAILIRRAPRGSNINFITIGGLPECVGCKKRVYNHSSGYIITGQERGRINLFSAHPNAALKPARKLKVGDSILKTVNIDPTGSFFVSYSAVGQSIFHLQTGQQIATLCSLPGFSHLSFSQDLNYLINSNDSGCKFLWRLPKKIVDTMKAKTHKMVAASRQFGIESYISYVRVCQQLVDEDPNIETVQEWETKRAIGESPRMDNLVLVDDVNKCDRDLLSLVDSESHTTCTTYSRSCTGLLSGEAALPIEIEDGSVGCKERKAMAESRKETNETPFQLANSDPCKQTNVNLHPIPGSESESIEKHEADENKTDRDDDEKVKEKVKEKTETDERTQSDTTSKGVPRHDLPPLPKPYAKEQMQTLHTPCNKSNFDHLPHLISVGNPTVSPSLPCKNNASDCDIIEQESELKRINNAEDDSMDGITMKEDSNPPKKVPSNYSNEISVCEAVESDSLARIPKRISTICMDSFVGDNEVRKNGRVESCDEDRIEGVYPNDCINTLPAPQTVGNAAIKEEENNGVSKPCHSPERQIEFNTDSSPTETQVICHTRSENSCVKKSLSTVAMACNYHEMEKHISEELVDPNAPLLDEYNKELLEQGIYHLEKEGRLHEYYNEFCRCVQLSNSQETYFMKDAEAHDVLNDIKPFLSAKHHVGEADCGNAMAESGEPLEYMGDKGESYEYSSNLKELFIHWVKKKMKKEELKGTHSPVYKEKPWKKCKSPQSYVALHKNHALKRSSVSSLAPNEDQESNKDFCPETATANELQTEETCQESVNGSTEPIDQGDGLFSIERSLMAGSRLTGCTSTSTSSQAIMERIGCVADLFRNQDDYLKKLKKVRKNFEMNIKALSVERKNLQIEAQKKFQE